MATKTGIDQDALIDMFAQAGATDQIPKPLHRESLLSALKGIDSASQGIISRVRA